jgi:hypothetical protein
MTQEELNELTKDVRNEVWTDGYDKGFKEVKKKLQDLIDDWRRVQKYISHEEQELMQWVEKKLGEIEECK